MGLSKLALVLIIGLLPTAVLANPDGGERPRWDREAYKPDRSASGGKRWEQMNPQEREEIRRRKAQYDSLPSSEQRRLRNAREEFEKMSPDRRREMRERWESLPPQEKERYRLEREKKREIRGR